MSIEEKKKLKDKVEKKKKECEITKAKYKNALDALNAYKQHYIEDMNVVFKKCDSFEKERMEFFKQTFIKLQGYLNIYEKMNVEEIYAEFFLTFEQSSFDKDLVGWSKEFGASMEMNWPTFEEFPEAKRRECVAIDADKCVATKLLKRTRGDVKEGATRISNSHFSTSPVDVQYR